MQDAPIWLKDVIRCPRCSGAIPDLRCPSCDLTFGRTSNGAPILIDFAASVISLERTTDGGATKTRRGYAIRRIAGPLMTLTNGSGSITAVKEAARFLAGKVAPRILLVGGGERWDGLDELMAIAPDAEIVNSDVYPAPHTHILTDAHQLAFADGTFDMTIAQAVLEHLIDPPATVAEIWRVLKDDGVVLADTPFMQPVHDGAYDFTRYSPLGQRALFRRFDLLGMGISAGPMSSLRWAIEHGLRSMFRTKWVALAMRPLTIPLMWIDQFSPNNRYAQDGCCGAYFIGRKSQTAATPRQIISEYRGAL